MIITCFFFGAANINLQVNQQALLSQWICIC
jgi:hypothetical protein